MAQARCSSPISSCTSTMVDASPVVKQGSIGAPLCHSVQRSKANNRILWATMHCPLVSFDPKPQNMWNSLSNVYSSIFGHDHVSLLWMCLRVPCSIVGVWKYEMPSDTKCLCASASLENAALSLCWQIVLNMQTEIT